MGGFRRDWRGLAIALATLLAPSGVASAAELSGNVYVYTGTTDRDSVKSDTVDQRYTLSLRQSLTEYLSARLGYRFFDFTSQTASNKVGRRTSEPTLELVYSHPRVYGSLSFVGRTTTGTGSVGDFESDSLLGHLSWRPLDSTIFSVRYRDESNSANFGVFGRGSDSRVIDLEGAYQRRYWSTAYSYEIRQVENAETGLDFEEGRHELRLNASRSFFGDRLNLTFGSEVDRRDQREQRPGSGDLAEPVTAIMGLFVVDPSPAVGELEPTPALVDGDFETPAAAGAEIGGAFTYRNFGVDLGLTQPVTRLEVSVDAPSAPGLPWQVFHSQDNLVWEPVPGVAAAWDESLLSYTLRFPETTDRYFKAVNVGVNSETDVRVTELRAFVDITGESLGVDGETTLYRVDGAATFRPHDRVTGIVSFGMREDEGLSGGALRRDFSDVHGSARLSVELPGHLALVGDYRYVDFENRVEPVLVRSEELASTSLIWTPLDTLQATVAHLQRDESDEAELLRSTTTTRLLVDAELLPGLRLDSALEWSDVEDPLFGRDRSIFVWREMVDAQPFRTLRVAGGYEYLSYETADGAITLERSSFELRTTWNASPYLTLNGDWRYDDEDTGSSLRQSYGISYSPGTKLTLSAYYQDFETDSLRQTTASNLAVTYRLNPRLQLFGNLTRSESSEAAGTGVDITSMRVGLALFF